MAQEEIPLFHNFFGSVPQLKEDNKQLSHPVAANNPVKSGKNSWVTEEVGQERHSLEASQSTSVFDESSTVPVSDSGDFRRTALRMDMDALDSSRLFKRSRMEKVDEKKKGHDEALVDELNLTMHPPRLMSRSSNVHPSLTTTADIPTKAWDCNVPASLGMFGPGRASQKGLHADNVMANSFRDINAAASSLLHIPPADEGSRTGLKGSSVGSLLNRAMTGGPRLSLGHSKSSSRGAGSESTFAANQENTPITRQLTIFYGGQAHVFEDVSSDKAEAIMTLAGSSGRSWSTVYSPGPKSSMPLSASEGSLSTFERERAKRGSKPSSTNVFENNLGISAEIHNALSSLFHKGLGRAGDSRAQEQSSQFTKWASDMQMIAGIMT
eukprot:c20354_g1_i3 orf=742-1887(+)